MVRIRFRRVGKKKQPSFRLVAADKESPRDGRFLEILGFYNPRTEPATIKLKEDRIFDWISKGAQLSDSARSVLKVAGALERYDRFVAGEDIEKLLQEAAAGDATRNISEKTRREPPVGKPKAKPKAEEPKAEAEEEAAVEEAKAEVVEEKAEAKEEAPAEEPKAEAEAKEEAPAEEPKAKAEAKEEAPAEEPKAEKAAKEEAPAEEPKAKAEPKEKPKAEKEAPAITSSRASVDKLDLPANISAALIEGGFKSIGKLAKQMEADTAPILEVNGVGPKAVETIAEKLAAYTP